MKVALAQIGTTVADFAGNSAKILAGVARAKEAGAKIVLFPELAVTGYPPRDLLDRPGFLRDAERAVAELAPKITGISAVFGSVLENPTAQGKPAFNAAVVVEGGKVVAHYRKCLLPTYDVFDEARYFEPGHEAVPTTVAGVSSALTVCEDIWDDPDYSPMRRYGQDPVGAMVHAGAKCILNISASPFEIGKPMRRETMLASIAAKHGLPLAYCNLVGGNDELVFDGYSVVLDRHGKVVAQGKPFAEDFLVADLDDEGRASWTHQDDLDDVHDALVLGLRDYAAKCRFTGAVLGLSGGVDSALVAALAAEAMGPENVHVFSLPTRFTASISRDDAKTLAKNLGSPFGEAIIEPVFDAMLAAAQPEFLGKPWDATEENLQSRIRGTILMSLSNKHGWLLLSTGNKSEMAVGYCTLYGDMNGGLAVISDVPKTMVYRLCARINAKAGREIIPARILTRAPSAELRENQTDQDSLPPYDILDRILELYIVERKTPAEIVAATGFDEALVIKTARMIEVAEFKRRQAAPGLKVTAKAFGVGRRNPIARAF